MGGPRLIGCLLSCLLATACQNDYPLEPTPCDDWCHATATCEWSDPADCVALCEEEGLYPESPECRAAWDEAMRCLNALPAGAACNGMTSATGEGQDCSAEQEAVWLCAYGDGLE